MAKFIGLNRVPPAYSFDPGALAGPSNQLVRLSASPAAADLLGELPFIGNSSTLVQRTFASLLAQILDPTNGSEDGELLLRTIVAGTLATRFHLGQGLYSDGVSGGDKGVGTINLGAYYQNGALLGQVSDIAVITHQATSGSNGGSVFASSFFTGTLTTIVSQNISGGTITLVSNVLSGFPAGNYLVNGWAIFGGDVDKAKLRLRKTNATAATAVVGASAVSTNIGRVSTIAPINGRFTVASSADTYELQYFVSQAVLTTGQGVPASSGEVEVYKCLVFQKV